MKMKLYTGTGEVAKRYESLVGPDAIDAIPTNTHGWFNRACALTRWAQVSGSWTCKVQAKIAFQKAKETHHEVV